MSKNMTKNYYELLGLSNSATAEDIKKAYRALAKKLHPDTETGDEKLFKEISEAYEVLSHLEKRMMYDAGEDPSDYVGTKEKAANRLGNLMFTITEKFGFMADVSDLIILMREELNEISLKMHRDIESNALEIDKYNVIDARLKKADFLKATIVTHIEHLENKAKTITADLECQEVMLELLSESTYEIEVDEDMEWTPKGIGFING